MFIMIFLGMFYTGKLNIIAINMFLTQIIKKDGIPFEITNSCPSKYMIEALKEIEYILKQYIDKANDEDKRIKTNTKK